MYGRSKLGSNPSWDEKSQRQSDSSDEHGFVQIQGPDHPEESPVRQGQEGIHSLGELLERGRGEESGGGGGGRINRVGGEIPNAIPRSPLRAIRQLHVQSETLK